MILEFASAEKIPPLNRFFLVTIIFKDSYLIKQRRKSNVQDHFAYVIFLIFRFQA